MKEGDICMIYGNPAKCTHPIDQARLIKKISETASLEQWYVEYLNDPDKQYTALIKKEEGDNTLNIDIKGNVWGDVTNPTAILHVDSKIIDDGESK